MPETPVIVTVISNADKSTQATFDVESPSWSERLRNAGKKSLPFWGLALVSLFIPVAHFVLVPLFIMVAVATLYVQTGHSLILRRAELRCPNCAKETSLPTGAFSWPQRTDCPKCEERLLITKKESG